MPRPVKRNKKPMITVTISEDLWKNVTRRKPRRRTMDEYLTHLVEGYFYLKENYKFVEDAFEKASKKNEEYVKRISLLESQLTDIGVSPEISPELELDPRSWQHGRAF